jgi:hypothetical protein
LAFSCTTRSAGADRSATRTDRSAGCHRCTRTLGPGDPAVSSGAPAGTMVNCSMSSRSVLAATRRLVPAGRSSQRGEPAPHGFSSTGRSASRSPRVVVPANGTMRPPTRSVGPRPHTIRTGVAASSSCRWSASGPSGITSLTPTGSRLTVRSYGLIEVPTELLRKWIVSVAVRSGGKRTGSYGLTSAEMRRPAAEISTDRGREAASASSDHSHNPVSVTGRGQASRSSASRSAAAATQPVPTTASTAACAEPAGSATAADEAVARRPPRLPASSAVSAGSAWGRATRDAS